MSIPPSPALRRLRDNPWVWLAPVLLPFVVFLLLPILAVARLSLMEWGWFESRWVGMEQYRRLAADPEFWRALGHTLLFAAVVVPAWVLLTLIVASAIAPRIERARHRWMTAFYMTYLVSPVVLAIVWSWMLAPGEAGVFNRMLGAIGVGPVPWLTEGGWAMASVILSTALTIPGP